MATDPAVATTDGEPCDVFIAGGGMVGASLAVALAGLHLRVGLAEAVPLGGPGQPSFDRRTVALSRSSQRILDSLGLWSGLEPEAAPIRRIHVSEQGRFGSTVIDAAREGVPALGYVIGNARIGAALWGALNAARGVALHVPGEVQGVEPAGEYLRVLVRRDAGVLAVPARLLVVADGARSRLRAALGIEARVRPYGQTAIIGTVGLTRGRVGDLAFERFTPSGPLALLPAGADRYAFVVTRRTDDAPATLALDDAGFVGVLQAAFGNRAGRFAAPSPRVAYPLELVTAAAVTAPRAVVIGNAANGLHPVAGQGYNLGLRDVAALAEVIADDVRRHGAGADPGADAVIGQYGDWRRRDQRNVVAFTDGLVRAFGVDAPLLGPLRGLSLLAFDLLPGAKGLLARETMGLGGRMSRLARGLPL
ncbi:MAG: 2-octaprenyl-6-methoxyphenyl hydroxylase [Chromatiales bacterium]|jgi:2-octaprenyl-6-methoxyphenol hydroxylase|nr:2-octaprenyl-6-methoxyphenyl hydroxylase [Chromatiales bacterium]